VRRLGRAGKACLAGLKWILRAAGFFKAPDNFPDRRELAPPPKSEWPDLIRPFFKFESFALSRGMGGRVEPGHDSKS